MTTEKLDLEVLKKQYQTVLLQYNQAQADYLEYLQRESKITDKGKLTSNSDNKYAEIKGRAFWGTKSLSEQSAETIEQCKSVCSSLSNCTGATFNKDKKYCWLRSGDGSIVDGQKADVALIPEKVRLMKVMQNFASQLASINEKILRRMEAETPALDEEKKESQEQVQVLKKNYQNLVKERKNIEAELSKYEDVEQAQNDGELNIQKYRAFYLLSIIGVFFILSLFGAKFMQPQEIAIEDQGNSSTMNLIIFGVFIFLTIVAIPYIKTIRQFVGV